VSSHRSLQFFIHCCSDFIPESRSYRPAQVFGHQLALSPCAAFVVLLGFFSSGVGFCSRLPCGPRLSRRVSPAPLVFSVRSKIRRPVLPRVISLACILVSAASYLARCCSSAESIKAPEICFSHVAPDFHISCSLDQNVLVCCYVSWC
jgi:hypothetical protein